MQAQYANSSVNLPKTKSTNSMRTVLWSGIIGTAVEWYDFLIYAAASALVFNKLFFPSIDPTLGTIAAFGTYAVGYFARPLGGIIFGHFGDRIGRKAVLSITILLMALGTFAIGLLPTYETIGIAAPALLVFLRFVQGIGIGGEWAGAVLMVIENAPTKKRGLFGSMVQIGNPIGNLAALGIFFLVSQLSEPDFLSWGWRIPFLISILFAAIGLFIRLRLDETPAFKNVQQKNDVVKIPLFEVLTNHPKTFITAVCLKVSEICYASVASVFVLSYITNTLGLTRDVGFKGVLASSFIALFAIPFFGALSDKFGRKKVSIGSCLFAIVFAFPLFALLDTKDPMIIAVAIIVAITFGQMVMFSVGASWYTELFPAKLRYSGASLGFQVGAAISGGLTPILVATLLRQTGTTTSISIFMMVMGTITLIAALFAKETAGKALSE